MERDALLAHGTAFLLKDRLMNCSDYSTAWVCRSCGSLISLGFDELKNGDEAKGLLPIAKKMDVVAVPYVFRYVSRFLKAGVWLFAD